jgi:hypothetical protein
MTPLNFDEQLSRAVETLGERLRDDISRQLRQLADDLSESAKVDREAAVAAVPVPEAPAALATTVDHDATHTWLLEGIRRIDSARSLNDVLSAVVDAATQHGLRVGLFLVHESRVRAHQPPAFAASFAGLDIPLQNAGIVGDAIQQRRAASGSRDSRLPPFASSDTVEAAAFPIELDGKAVAVLYVERQDTEVPALNPAALEVLARHAARALEALTAFKAARALAPADTGSMSPAPPANAGADQEEAARRYARLVISEIKLYNEDAVAEGRRAGDLATRLGGEIARARALYEQRVPVHFRGAAEHFQAELVRTLGGGDATLFEKATVS